MPGSACFYDKICSYDSVSIKDVYNFKQAITFLKVLSITFTTKISYNNYFMRVLAAIIVLLLVFPGCGKDRQTAIPYVYVNLELHPNTLDYIGVGSYKYVNGGYRGIVIYRLLPDEFRVYERCCPFDPEKTGAQVSVDPSFFTATDPVCTSKFSLLDGSPISGPSPYSLLQYRYSFDGDDRLLIYN